MRIRTTEGATELERTAARLLEDRLRRRGVSDVAVLLATRDADEVGDVAGLEDLGDEGFAILERDGEIVVAANAPAGVLFGAGRVWRDLALGADGWTMPSLPVADRPRTAVRTIYFADHMGNWYSHAPAEDQRELLEDMALWGYNELMTCLAVQQGETFFDTVERLHAFEDHARALGMRVGTVLQSNTSFNRPPEGMNATSGPIPGAHDVCASKPGARDFLVDDKRVYYEIMKPYDVVTLWPYDGGGCYCDECKPWARTYLELSERIAREAITSGEEVRASAWFFERHMPGEDEALFAYLAGAPTWFRYVLAGADEARRWLADGRALPDPYRALLFPDIAMFDGAPWGGRGANPAAVRFTAEIRDTLPLIDGAVVYSEGRYDDVNKIVWARMLWDPALEPAAVLGEYARVYLGADVADDVAALLLQIEEGMERLPDGERWRRGIFHPEWDAPAGAIEERLSQDARAGWRWRYIRAKTSMEADHAAARAGDAEALTRLRRTYDEVQERLNLYDPARSLATWFWAPAEEAFALPSSVEA